MGMAQPGGATTGPSGRRRSRSYSSCEVTRKAIVLFGPMITSLSMLTWIHLHSLPFSQVRKSAESEIRRIRPSSAPRRVSLVTDEMKWINVDFRWGNILSNGGGMSIISKFVRGSTRRSNDSGKSSESGIVDAFSIYSSDEIFFIDMLLSKQITCWICDLGY